MRSLCTVVVLASFLGIAPPPAQATSCVLNGPFVLASALSFEGTPAQVSGTFTFTPGACTPGTAGTADVSLSILFAGSPTPLTFAGSFAYIVDDTGAVTIGQDLLTGFTAAVEGMGLANALVFVAAPTIADRTIRLAGTAVRSALMGVEIGPNTAIGLNAFRANTTGFGNTAVGVAALFHNTMGGSNTAVGATALTGNTIGNGNTAVGSSALFSNTGSSNIALGDTAGSGLTTGNFNIDIGHPGLSGESNAIRIGIPGLQTATFIAGISGATSSSGAGVFVNSSGQLGTITSAHRFKEDVRDMGDASEGLMRLRPVTFRYKPEHDDGTRLRQYGLIAEEVAEVYPELVVQTSAGDALTVRSHVLPALLLNELQKQQRQLEAQASQLQAQRAQLEAQARQIQEQAARLAELAARLEATLGAAGREGSTTALRAQP